jgi:hypothetical protein
MSAAENWFVLPNIGVGVGGGGGGGGGGPCGERTAGLVEGGWEDTSISIGTSSYHSKQATVVTTATSQTKKHTNVTPEGRRMAEQRDTDELVEKYITPLAQTEIISLMQINPAVPYGIILPVVPVLIRLARAILVRHYGNNNLTDQEVADAIVRSIRARHNRVADTVIPPEIRLPAPADGPTDLSSVSMAPPLADAANADIPHQGPDHDSSSLSTAASINGSSVLSFGSSALARQYMPAISRDNSTGGGDPTIVPPIAEEYVD